MQQARPSATSILSRQVSWRVSAGAPDPRSVLRLACIRFVETDAARRQRHLLRVEMERLTDIGAVGPRDFTPLKREPWAMKAHLLNSQN